MTNNRLPKTNIRLMQTIKTGREFTLLHKLGEGVFSVGVVESKEDGYYLNYGRVLEDGELQPVSILLTVEEKLDREDLDNINHILQSENLSFVQWN